MSDMDSVNFYTAFVLGLSKEKQALISQVISAQAALESFVTAKRKELNLVSSPVQKFCDRANEVIGDPQWQSWVRYLNKARNRCLHRSASFHEREVMETLGHLNTLIREIEERYPKRMAVASAIGSKFLAAIAAFLSELAENFGIAQTEPIVLDGFHPPGRKSLAEHIQEVVGE